MIEAGTILVADDSSDDVELLRRALHKAGIRNPVRCLTDGSELIRYLEDNGPDLAGESPSPLLVFLDLNMPRCTGFTVLDWLRQHPELRHLPTIVFSNSGVDSDIERSLRLGAAGYWVKPSRFEDLVKLMHRLKALLSRVAQNVEAATVPAAVAA